MKLDLTKPYQTRDGREARVVEGPGGWLFGYIRGITSERAYGATWMPGGHADSANSPHPTDLVNIPEKRSVKVWMNINPVEDTRYALIGGTYTSRKEADNWCSPNRLACIECEITYTVGEGLTPPHGNET